MIFSTYTFILLFLPITFFGYRMLSLMNNSLYAKIWLVIASLYFYAQGSGKFFYIFTFIVLFNYVIGTMIVRSSGPMLRRLLLGVGLFENIATLAYYKYTNFFLENLNAVSGHSYSLKNIILPIGISFFTFQLISFLVDCYRRKVEQFSLVNYLVFITFFPQLVVGPIVHHSDIIPQLEERQQRLFHSENFMRGVFLFSMGCAKKIALADPLTAFAQGFYSDVASADSITAWLAVIGYTFSYYFDLSGYADMAIGIGLMFNIRLPSNFNSPYKARNFRVYWQRWHITLSRFLSDYIFRGIYKKGRGSFNFYFAVMVTFFVSGMWHGAGWTFILWGILNGGFVCASHFMYRNKIALPFALAWTLTFIGIIATRILFVSTDLPHAGEVLKALFQFHEFAGLGAMGIAKEIVIYIAYHLYTCVLLLIAACIIYFAKNSEQILDRFKPNFRYALATACLLVLSLSQMTTVSDFLYFQF